MTVPLFLKSTRAKFSFICLIFLLLRAFFYFLSPTELGDTYNFFHFSDALSHFIYPVTEKRLPLFSLILIPGLLFSDPVVYGRVLVTGISLLTLFLVYRYSFSLFKKSNFSLASVALCALSPFYFYWSSRVLTEALFSFLVLLAFYIFYRKKYFALGIICALAAITRYEGVILMISFILYLLIKKDFRNFVIFISLPVFALGLVFIRLLNSPYLLEPSGFHYSPWSFFIIPAGLLFIFGIIPHRIPSLNLISKCSVKKMIEYSPFALFIIFSLSLFFLWVAALPRLFCFLIPLLSVPAGRFILSQNNDKKIVNILIWCLCLGFLIYFRQNYRFQFLFLDKGFALVFLLISFSAIISLIALNKKSVAFTLATLGMVVSLFSYSFYFKDVYISVYKSLQFANNLEGKIIYSDETGLTGWYLKNKNIVYFDDTEWPERVKSLKSNGVRYAIVTNEFDELRRLVFIEKKSNRSEVKMIFEKKINDRGYMRYTRIYEII